MKKSLIALAVAGALTAPMIAQADATVYGNVEVEYVKADDFGTGLSKDADIQIDDARLGVRGESELENLEGVKSFFKIEVEYNNGPNALSDSKTVTVRQTNVGLRGNFGEITVGRFDNPAEDTEGLDKYSESLSTSEFFGGTDRLKGVTYRTPTMGGFDAYAVVVVDSTGTGSEDKSTDGYVIGANASVAGLGLHAAFTSVDQDYLNAAAIEPGSTDDLELTQLSADYSVAGVTLEAMYQMSELKTTTKDEFEVFGLGASYAMGNATIGATYFDAEEETDGVKTFEADEVGVYASYKLGAKASVKVQYSQGENEPVGGAKTDADAFVLGYNVSF